MALEWSPDRRTLALWMVLGSVLALVGPGLFAAAYALRRGGEATVVLSGPQLLAALTAFVFLLALHELVHGLAMLALGVKPRFGVGAFHGILPYAYATAPGRRFTRRRYILIALAPFATISGFGLLWMVYGPWSELLILPLGVHLGACIGDLWVGALCLRQPRGTLIEDLRTGVRFHPPLSQQG